MCQDGEITMRLSAGAQRQPLHPPPALNLGKTCHLSGSSVPRKNRRETNHASALRSWPEKDGGSESAVGIEGVRCWVAGGRA